MGRGGAAFIACNRTLLCELSDTSFFATPQAFAIPGVALFFTQIVVMYAAKERLRSSVFLEKS